MKGGDNVVIHCQGGLGRAGTIGGCLFVALGNSPEDALAEIRRARGPNAPETQAQKEFIRGFATHWNAAKNAVPERAFVPGRCNGMGASFVAEFRRHSDGWALCGSSPAESGEGPVAAAQTLRRITIAAEYAGCCHCGNRTIFLCGSCHTMNCLADGHTGRQARCVECKRTVTFGTGGGELTLDGFAAADPAQQPEARPPRGSPPQR
jgi:hypothetical protein